MRRRLLLIVLVDALGYEQARDISVFPCLPRPRAPVQSVLGYSSAALPTLLSGLLPAEHGHLAMYRRAGRDGVFGPARTILPLLGRATGRHWALRRWTSRWLRARGVTGYFSLYEVPLADLPKFDLCQRRDLFAPGGFGNTPGLADLIDSAGGLVWGWRIDEQDAFVALRTEIKRGERQVFLLYTAALDAAMHADGPDGGKPKDLLDAYGRRFEELLSLASNGYDEVRMFVFGDHGMARVRASHDLWGELKALRSTAEREYTFFLDSTMARFWFSTDTARREVTTLLERCTYGRVLEDDELKRLGAFFPGREYGEVIFLVREGEILLPSFMSSSTVMGMHGYHPDDASMYTTLATNCMDVEDPEDLRGIHRLLVSEIESIHGGNIRR